MVKVMEDSYICALNIGNNNQYDIFGFFDGDNRKEVSQFAKKPLYQRIRTKQKF